MRVSAGVPGIYQDGKPKFCKTFSLPGVRSNFNRPHAFATDAMFFSFSAVRLARYFRSCLTGQRCFYAACPFGQATFSGQLGNDGVAERFVPVAKWHV